jgi:hypothetical protein
MGTRSPATPPELAEAYAPTRDPDGVYREREARFGIEESRAERLSRALSATRLLTFLAAAACLAVGFESARARAFEAAAGLGAAFVALLLVHERVIRTRDRYAALHRINEGCRARLAYDWTAAPLPEAPAEGRDEPVARDLNLFGRASLFQLLGGITTPPGRETLAAWLLAPAEPDEIRARQAAVRSLSAAIAFRQEWQAAGRTAPPLAAFLAWAESAPWLSRIRWARPAAWILGLTATAGLAAAMLGWIPYGLPLAVAAINGALSLALVGRIHESYGRISARKGQFAPYAALFRLAASGSLDVQDAKLAALRAGLEAEGVSASREIDRLDWLVSFSEARLVPLFYFPLQVLLLWDLHLFLRLEAWQQSVGPRVRRWVEILGQIEALSALSTVSFENPSWSFPVVLDGARAEGFAARDLGHPLIAPALRVVNDVTLGPRGTFTLLTGSNMSGKSTLLRAIGVNVILAQVGGPVCASSLHLPPLCLGTSVVVEDSLADGVSFFLAELKRLKTIIDLSRSAAAGGRTLLFLLDEILRGTNSVERRLAVQEVLLHLLEHGAFGVVSTHDLSLADVPELRSPAQVFHFRETIGDGDGAIMTFDYKLRPGVATTTNAMRLLDLVGLRFRVGQETR